MVMLTNIMEKRKKYLEVSGLFRILIVYKKEVIKWFSVHQKE